jgi:hypothetical protein
MILKGKNNMPMTPIEDDMTHFNLIKIYKCLTVQLNLEGRSV